MSQIMINRLNGIGCNGMYGLGAKTAKESKLAKKLAKAKKNLAKVKKAKNKQISNLKKDRNLFKDEANYYGEAASQLETEANQYYNDYTSAQDRINQYEQQAMIHIRVVNNMTLMVDMIHTVMIHTDMKLNNRIMDMVTIINS
jgi:uncharacterized coiled-coil DUF342 family protein